MKEEEYAVNDSVVFIGTGSPQKSLSLSEEVSSKKQTDDTMSMASSLHSSPPASPQGSPRKGTCAAFTVHMSASVSGTRACVALKPGWAVAGISVGNDM